LRSVGTLLSGADSWDTSEWKSIKLKVEQMPHPPDKPYKPMDVKFWLGNGPGGPNGGNDASVTREFCMTPKPIKGQGKAVYWWTRGGIPQHIRDVKAKWTDPDWATIEKTQEDSRVTLDGVPNPLGVAGLHQMALVPAWPRGMWLEESVVSESGNPKRREKYLSCQIVLTHTRW
jgi:hypothetical protein